ncbi:3-isopropylmalate dehydratase [Ferroplasma sp.]|uniref:LeuD/DmdB family oxidoreductase small subunit n=1 Tax=Ferroplasma sp. TaxID=2591003 RepID=UPI00307F0124
MNNIEGKIWIFGDDINTDLMYPQICYTLPEKEKPCHAMEANRPGWAQQVKNGDIIVAGKNFGTGSSRPAADNLKNLGIACVIAESINGLFLRNAVNSALPALEAHDALNIGKELDAIAVDFNNNKIINKGTGIIINFRPLPAFLMEIIDNGGIINILKNKGLIGDPL